MSLSTRWQAENCNSLSPQATYGANLNCKMFIANLNSKQQTKHRDHLCNLTLNMRNMLLKQCHMHCCLPHVCSITHILHDMLHNTENNSSESTMDIVSSLVVIMKLYVNHLYSLST
jgi:hypothetical protein